MEIEVKATGLPAQTGLTEGVTEILTGSNGLTVMDTRLEAAGLFTGQIALEVSWQATSSPFKGI